MVQYLKASWGHQLSGNYLSLVTILKLKDNQSKAPNEALGCSQSIIFLLCFHLFSIEVPLMACLLSAPNNFWFGFNWCPSIFAQIKSQNIICFHLTIFKYFIIHHHYVISNLMDMSPGSWRWTGKPDVQPMGSQRVGQDWVTELNWCIFNIWSFVYTLTELI